MNTYHCTCRACEVASDKVSVSQVMKYWNALGADLTRVPLSGHIEDDLLASPLAFGSSST